MGMGRDGRRRRSVDGRVGRHTVRTDFLVPPTATDRLPPVEWGVEFNDEFAACGIGGMGMFGSELWPCPENYSASILFGGKILGNTATVDQ